MFYCNTGFMSQKCNFSFLDPIILPEKYKHTMSLVPIIFFKCNRISCRLLNCRGRGAKGSGVGRPGGNCLFFSVLVLPFLNWEKSGSLTSPTNLQDAMKS